MSPPPARERGGVSVKPSVIPGFGLTLGFTLAYLTLIVLIPLAALALARGRARLGGFWAIATDRAHAQRARDQLRRRRCIAALVNVVFGCIVAWVLVRYQFPGRRLLDAIVDLPFALPTAVAGIALAALYAPNGWIGAALLGRRSASRSPTRRSASSSR